MDYLMHIIAEKKFSFRILFFRNAMTIFTIFIIWYVYKEKIWSSDDLFKDNYNRCVMNFDITYL